MLLTQGRLLSGKFDQGPHMDRDISIDTKHVYPRVALIDMHQMISLK